MALKKMADTFGKWAQKKIAEALADQGSQPTPLEAIRIDTANHPDHVDQVITRLMGAVAGLQFGPDGWSLNVFKTGDMVAVPSYQLPNWEVID